MRIVCIAILTMSVLMLSSASAVAQQPPGIRWQSDADKAWQATRESGRLLLLYIKTTNCHFCNQMESITFRDAGVSSDVASWYVPTSVYAKDWPKLVERLSTKSYPSLYIISPDGVVLDAVYGFSPPAKLRQTLRAAAAKLAAREESENK